MTTENVTNLNTVRKETKAESLAANTSANDQAAAFNSLYDKEAREGLWAQVEYFLTKHNQGPKYDRAYLNEVRLCERCVTVELYAFDDFNEDNKGEWSGYITVTLETPRIPAIWNFLQRMPSRKARKLQLLARTISDQLDIARQLDMVGLEDYIAKMEADLESVSRGQLPYYNDFNGDPAA